MNLDNSERANKARALFREGYNCAQSSFLAFNDIVDMSFEEAARMACSFGAGMGRLREVCGGLTGIFMVAGLLYASEDPNDQEQKVAHYERIQYLARRFKEVYGTKSFICRDLLGLSIDGADIPTPSVRTAEYYAQRPCEKLIAVGAAVLEEYIQKHPYK